MRVLDTSTSGSILYAGHQIAILSIPMNGSCAIPLKILGPKAVDLIAWSFVGFSSYKSVDQSCFLVLGCQDECNFSSISSVSVRTHVGDRSVILGSRSTPLSRAEASAIAKAVISALEPRNFEHFRALIPILKEGLDTIFNGGIASNLSIKHGDSDDIWRAQGINFVPDCMILRSTDSYECSLIASIRFFAFQRAEITLPISHLRNTHSVNGAILSGHGRYEALRVIGAM